MRASSELLRHKYFIRLFLKLLYGREEEAKKKTRNGPCTHVCARISVEKKYINNNIPRVMKNILQLEFYQ